MPHLYGDLTRAVISSLAAPLFWYKALVQQPLSDLKVSQVIICLSMTLIAKYSWQSYLFRDLNACYAGFAATNVLTIVTCLYKFPNPESHTLLGHFYMYLVFAGANTSLSFVVKLCMAWEASVVVIVLAYVSPHYTLKKIVPIVIATSGTFDIA
jgi:hypothetical protein